MKSVWSFITKKISITKSTESKSDEPSEDHDEQLYGIILLNGQELFGYIPTPVKNGVLSIRKPLLALTSYDEHNFTESYVLLHPWSMVTNLEVYPINAATIVAIYPITKDIRGNHETVWVNAQKALAGESVDGVKVIRGKELSKDVTITVPKSQMKN